MVLHHQVKQDGDMIVVRWTNNFYLDFIIVNPITKINYKRVKVTCNIG